MFTVYGTCVYYGYDRPVFRIPIKGSEEIIPAMLAVDSPIYGKERIRRLEDWNKSRRGLKGNEAEVKKL